MNENLNLVKILKDCPKSTKLYSTMFGEVEYENIDEDVEYPITFKTNKGTPTSVTSDGKYFRYYDGECTLFPSKEQHDWSKFTSSRCNIEKQDEQILSQANERAWLYLVSDVLTWKDGIGQYLDDPRVQELAKKLYSKYAQKLYKPQVLSDNSNIEKNEQKSSGEIEPKFKVGNWYQCTKNFVGKGVIFDRNTAYYCAQEGCLQDEYGCHIAIVKDLYDRFKLWTIQDAKDGDILSISWWEDEDLWEKIVIFKKYHSDGVKGLYSTPCVEGYGNTFKNGKLAFKEEVPYYSRTWTCKLHLATREQRDTLIKAMDDAGYKWDAEKKELNKKDGFDPKTLKPFDKVLVRDYSDDVWNCSILSHTQQKGRYNYACINGANWEYCIPYNDDTKHLAGTTEEAPEFYRYWED